MGSCFRSILLYLEKTAIKIASFLLKSLGGHIVSRGSTWDLNPVLAVGNSVLSLASKGKIQHLSVMHLCQTCRASL